MRSAIIKATDVSIAGAEIRGRPQTDVGGKVVGQPIEITSSSLTTSVLTAARRKPLAACIAVLFALAAPEAFAANTWAVTTCADHGTGSLRAVIAAPTTLSGDTVDLSGLSCSTVSLTTGAITIAQNDLTVQGPARRAVITGFYNGAYENARVLTHTGTGTLNLRYLDVDYNHFAPTSGDAVGGCIYSKGNVILNHVLVLSCTAKAPNGASARGGGVSTAGNLIAKYSQITGNSTLGSGAGGSSGGGGVVVGGTFTAANSTSMAIAPALHTALPAESSPLVARTS